MVFISVLHNHHHLLLSSQNLNELLQSLEIWSAVDVKFYFSLICSPFWEKNVHIMRLRTAADTCFNKNVMDKGSDSLKGWKYFPNCDNMD